MSNVTTEVRAGAEISKRRVDTGRATRVEYRFDSTADSAVTVRVVERLPEPVARSDVVFPEDDRSGDWEYVNGQHLAYAVDVADSDSVETEFTVSSPVDAGVLDSEFMVSTRDGDGDGPSPGASRVMGDGQGAWVAPPNDGASEPSPAVGESRERSDRPAVGVVADGSSDGRVERTTLRAVERDLAVFVVVPSGRLPAQARVARRLGATVVRPSIEDPGPEDLRTALAVAARNRSLSGVVVAADQPGRVDFEASVAAFEATDDPVVDAVTERGQTRTLAGIPAYNEAETIGEVVRAATPHVDEVLVVDDGSDDETVDRARAAGATVVTHDRNQGYGRALQTLFEGAHGRDVDHLVVLDADGQHDAGDIPRLVSEQRETGAHIVIGSRFGEGVDTDLPLYRWFGLRVITLLTNASTGAFRSDERISDTQSGFRAYSGAAVDSLAASADALDDRMGASVDILHHAHANDFEVAEVPTTIRYDVENANTRNPVAHGLSVVNSILTTLGHERPVTVLGAPGFVVALVGITAGYWTLSQLVASDTFPVALAVVSAVLVLVGVLSSFTSIVLHSLNTHFDRVV